MNNCGFVELFDGNIDWSGSVQCAQPLTLHQRAPVWVATSKHQLLKDKKERGTVKHWLRSWRNIRKRFQIQQRQWLPHPTISLKVSNCRFNGSCERKPRNLTAPEATLVSSLIRVFILSTHVIDWPPRTIIRLLPTLKNSLQRGIRSVGMHKTSQPPTYISKDWRVGSTNLR